MRQQVELTVFSFSHRDLLERWLAAPHVAPWYPEPAEHIAWALNPPLGGERALIVTRGEPVGYIRWQLVSRTTLDSVGLFEIPANSADVDLLIGEQDFVGHGIGPRALQLLTEALQARGDVPLIGLTTSVHNHAARRAFEASGFQVLRQYAPSRYGLCYLMVLQLRTGRDLVE